MYNYVPFITFILSSLLDAEATTPAYVAQESRARYRHCDLVQLSQAVKNLVMRVHN